MEQHNSQNNEVIKLLIGRAAGKADNRKIGLMLQGGGMRGSFGGGVMEELQRLGLSQSFDYIYSSSSGSFSAAYLLSDKAKEGTSIYWEDLSGNRFIQPWKIWKIMNLDYFIDKVVRDIKPLDFDKIKNANTIYKIFLAEPHSGITHAVNNKEDIDLLQALKATCSFPGCYYPLVKINGKKYLDGNSVKIFPLEQALEDGCTELLVIATVTEGFREKPVRGFIDLFLSNTLLFPLGRRFKERYRKRTKEYNTELDLVFGRRAFKGLNMYTICPDYMIKNSETNPRKLEDYAKHGEEVAKRAFS